MEQNPQNNKLSDQIKDIFIGFKEENVWLIRDIGSSVSATVKKIKSKADENIPVARIVPLLLLALGSLLVPYSWNLCSRSWMAGGAPPDYIDAIILLGLGSLLVFASEGTALVIELIKTKTLSATEYILNPVSKVLLLMTVFSYLVLETTSQNLIFLVIPEIILFGLAWLELVVFFDSIGRKDV